MEKRRPRKTTVAKPNARARKRVSSVSLHPAPSTCGSGETVPKVYGLLITKDDHGVFRDWCLDQLPLYNAVVCLDGSISSETAHIATQFADRLIYLHERDWTIAHKTDHGLRRVAHYEIIRRF